MLSPPLLTHYTHTIQTYKLTGVLLRSSTDMTHHTFETCSLDFGHFDVYIRHSSSVTCRVSVESDYIKQHP